MVQNKIKKITAMAMAATLLVGTMAITTAFAAATYVNNSKLYFNGGQNSSNVFSEIYDAKTSYRGKTEDNENFNVIAYVKVGGNEYNSQWRQGYAFKSASRKWYTNEISYYDYETRAEDYTSWGSNN